jgi:hypothetical protein
VRTGREWTFSPGYYLGGEVRRGGCGGIESGIRGSFACRFLALTWHRVYMYTLHGLDVQQQAS